MKAISSRRQSRSARCSKRRLSSTLMPSKDVLQRKLQDARITRREDLAERCAGKIHGRIAQIHEVRDIKCLGPEFDRLLLADLECPRQAHIDSNTLRAANITGAHSAVGAG